MTNQYEGMLLEVLMNGRKSSDRTGTGTRKMFGLRARFSLENGTLPVVTTKKVHLKSVILELLWILSGSTNVKWLQERGCHIWDEWADENGDLGPVYGKQWRDWTAPHPDALNHGVPFCRHRDQMADLVANLKKDPESRRHVVSAWNVGDLPEMALAPCHCLFQFCAERLTTQERIEEWRKRNPGSTLHMGSHDEGFISQVLDYEGIPQFRLSCQLYQRSADMFLGVPFNITSYALLTHMVAQQVNMLPHEFLWTGGDCHIYDNHVEQVNEQLTREARPYPTVRLIKAPDLFSYKPEHIIIDGYDPHPAIKAPVAV